MIQPEMDKRSRILIVEDDQDWLNVLIEGLSLNGYHCETAPNAEEAIALLGKTTFDCAFHGRPDINTVTSIDSTTLTTRTIILP